MSVEIRLLLLCCLVTSGIVVGDLVHYARHLVQPESPEYLIIPKFAKGEVPSWNPGKGRSFIDFSRLYVQSICSWDASTLPGPVLKPESEDDCKSDSQFEILMFEAPSDQSWKDYWDDEHYCCTKEHAAEGLCPVTQVNRLIIPNLPGSFVRSVTVPPAAGLINAISEHEIARSEVSSSGVYIAVMAQCNPDVAPLVLHGTIESLDPYGYLPADMFGNLPFYLTLSCCYLIIGMTWLVLCIVHWDQLMPLQFWITSVLIVGMIETSMLFAHYLNWNDEGSPALSLTVIGLFFGVVKRAMSRILVQLVALGYGVVRPSLGEDMTRVLYLGGAYFVCSLMYTMITSLPSSSRPMTEPQYDFLSLLVFVLATIDTTFYIWIFTSINNLMVSLATRKQTIKYLLYRNFRAVLVVMLLFTCAWALYGSVYFLNDNGASSNWRDKWTIDALWELIYFVIFVAVAVLWAPSHNSQRYAFSIELTQLDDDEEYQAAAHGELPSAPDDDGNGRDDLDGEYGGKLQDDKDPFQGTGALDPAMAMLKKA